MICTTFPQKSILPCFPVIILFPENFANIIFNFLYFQQIRTLFTSNKGALAPVRASPRVTIISSCLMGLVILDSSY